MRRAWTVVVSLVLLAACGGQSSSGPAETARQGDPAAYGVDAVDWPNTLSGARSLMSALPEALGGKHKQGGGAYAVCGDEYLSVQAREVREIARLAGTPADAPVLLAALASMEQCAQDSRAGTAPVADQGSVAGANDVWFACQVGRGAEVERRGAQVLQWTSGEVVWMAEAPTRDLMRALVSPLVDAASSLPGDGPGTRRPVTSVTAPYGLEDAAWPQTVEGAAKLAGKLASLEGHPPPGGRGGLLFADYPSGDSFSVSRAGKQMGADMELAASFGLIYSCARGSFRGTAPMIEGGQAAAPPPGSSVRWFTCDVKGAEGDPSFRGNAVGWTSGPLAWLLVTRSEQRSRHVMEALASWAGFS